MKGGLFHRLMMKKEPKVCPGCGGALINLGSLGLYCIGCGGIFSKMPKSGTFMMIGEPGSGKTLLLYKTVSHLLQQAIPCIFVACDQDPEKVRQSVEDLGYPMSKKGEWGSNQFADFIIVDAFSATTGMKSDEEYALTGMFDLNEMSIILSSLCDRLKNQAIGVFIDSANPLFTHLDPNMVMRFLHICGSKVAAKGGSFYFTLTPRVVDESIQTKLESIVDGILELRLSEGQAKPLRQFRVKKMRGKRMYEGWITFEVFAGKGIVFRCVGPDGKECLIKM